MQKQIRYGIFETNSSSTHSISINNNHLVSSLLLENDEGDIESSGGKFGCEIRTIHNQQLKLDYIVTYLCSRYKSEILDKDTVDDEVERIKASLEQDDDFKNLKEVIRDYCGTELSIKKNSDNDWYPLGYIDHQSINVADKVFKSKQNIASFIFNPQSVLHLDNDNH